MQPSVALTSSALLGPMTQHKRHAYQLILSLIAGSLLPLAFAPHHYWPIVFVCLPVVCFFLQNTEHASQAFSHALLFAFGAFSVGTSWVYVSIHTYGNASPFMAGLITFLFTAALALELGILMWLWRKLRSTHSYLHSCWILPAAWVLAEWCREVLFTGFPWLTLGSLANTPFLKGWIPLLGSYGMALLLLITCCHIAYAIRHKKRFITFAALSLVMTLAVGYGLRSHTWTKPARKTPLQVALVQGNVPVSMKWDADTLTTSLNRYLLATRHHLDADIIVWPETAIPAFDTSIPSFLQNMNELMIQHNAALITGIAHFDPSTRKTYNSLVTLGKHRGRYDKVHLVPFGEYFPASRLLGWAYNAMGLPMSNEYPGSTAQRTLPIANTHMAPAICYEVAYPALIQRRALKANWLLAISDDAWFGHSAASAQQIEMAQIRALETGRPMLYATNNGITAIINNLGDITKRLPKESYQTLTGSIMPREGLTPLQHLPLNLWQWLSLLACVLYGIGVRVRARCLEK